MLIYIIVIIITKCIDHRIAIDDLCNSLIECCLKASTITIPQTTSGITKEIPGWSDLAKQEREQSLFWHWIWCECGKLVNHITVIFIIL